MIYVVLSDIHGNLPALEAVEETFPRGGFKVICAGDLVGYGADPNECTLKVRDLGAIAVLGNHDAGVIGKMDPSYFNQYAATALEWTRANMGREERRYLEGLGYVHEAGSFFVVHGTLNSPEDFCYMFDEEDALPTFELLSKTICFIGHTHVAGAFFYKDGEISRSFREKISIEKGAKYIINAGSVGQPRDMNNRASYCVYDSDKSEVEFRRVEYDIKEACDRIKRAGIPPMLGERLFYGR